MERVFVNRFSGNKQVARTPTEGEHLASCPDLVIEVTGMTETQIKKALKDTLVDGPVLEVTALDPVSGDPILEETQEED